MVVVFYPGMEVKINGCMYKVGCTWASTEIGFIVSETSGGCDHQDDSVLFFNTSGEELTITFDIPDDGLDKHRHKLFKKW